MYSELITLLRIYRFLLVQFQYSILKKYLMNVSHFVYILYVILFLLSLTSLCSVFSLITVPQEVCSWIHRTRRGTETIVHLSPIYSGYWSSYVPLLSSLQSRYYGKNMPSTWTCVSTTYKVGFILPISNMIQGLSQDWEFTSQKNII